MAFIGYVFVPTPPTSDRARRLSAELVKTVEEFRRREPQTSDFDVQQAVVLASRTVDRTRSARMAAILAGVGVALVLGIALAFGNQRPGTVPWAPLAVLAVVAAVGLTVFLRRRE